MLAKQDARTISYVTEVHCMSVQQQRPERCGIATTAFRQKCFLVNSTDIKQNLKFSFLS